MGYINNAFVQAADSKLMCYCCKQKVEYIDDLCYYLFKGQENADCPRLRAIYDAQQGYIRDYDEMSKPPEFLTFTAMLNDSNCEEMVNQLKQLADYAAEHDSKVENSSQSNAHSTTAASRWGETPGSGRSPRVTRLGWRSSDFFLRPPSRPTTCSVSACSLLAGRYTAFH
ncbi:hypothetical protein GPALN_006870 [Globodera pallida]|nr:hypothetical protein GPALN_006870 [Globodera pallida]